jgi:hypothetical protein
MNVGSFTFFRRKRSSFSPRNCSPFPCLMTRSFKFFPLPPAGLGLVSSFSTAAVMRWRSFLGLDVKSWNLAVQSCHVFCESRRTLPVFATFHWVSNVRETYYCFFRFFFDHLRFFFSRKVGWEVKKRCSVISSSRLKRGKKKNYSTCAVLSWP